MKGRVERKRRRIISGVDMRARVSDDDAELSIGQWLKFEWECKHENGKWMVYEMVVMAFANAARCSIVHSTVERWLDGALDMRFNPLFFSTK